MLMKADRAVLARSAPAGAIYLGLLAAAAILVAFIGFSGGLKELLRRWTVQEEYSHGFLIPVIAAWLLWTRRDALRGKYRQAVVDSGRWSSCWPALLHIVGKLSSLFAAAAARLHPRAHRHRARLRRHFAAQGDVRCPSCFCFLRSPCPMSSMPAFRSSFSSSRRSSACSSSGCSRSRSISKATSSISASTSCRWSKRAAACAISIR